MPPPLFSEYEVVWQAFLSFNMRIIKPAIRCFSYWESDPRYVRSADYAGATTNVVGGLEEEREGFLTRAIA